MSYRNDLYTDFELQFYTEIKYRTEITLLDERVRNPQSPYLGVPSFSFTSPLFSVYLSTCPFIRISPPPYATTIVHPNGRGLLTHRCDASITANASCTRTQLHPHYSTLGFSRLINDLGDLVRLGTFALKWSTFLLFHRAWVLPKGMPTSSLSSVLYEYLQERRNLAVSANVRRVDRVK